MAGTTTTGHEGHAHDYAVGVPGMRTERLETLVDGVFAIAMTLLVLELKPPTGGDLAHELWAERDTFIAYVLSFANLGVFWVGHHAQFDAIHRVTRIFHWINIAFMLFVALIPFSTALLARNTQDPVAVVVYAANFMACGLMLLTSWLYATSHHRLVDASLHPDRIRYGRNRTLVGFAVSFIAILLAPYNTYASLALFAAVPIYYIVPTGRVDTFWKTTR